MRTLGGRVDSRQLKVERRAAESPHSFAKGANGCGERWYTNRFGEVYVGPEGPTPKEGGRSLSRGIRGDAGRAPEGGG